MHQTTNQLDRLYVAKPCTADWNAMTGNERVRFCDHCQLNVYNLSALTRSQAEELIAQSEGRLCTKFYRRADGTILTQDCPVGLRALTRRASKTASAVFSALLSLFVPGVTARPDDTAKTCSHLKIKIVEAEAQNVRATITGAVFDITRAVIPRARVTVVEEHSGKQWETRSNEEGQFGFTLLPPGSYSITIWSPGFASFKKDKLKIAAKEELQMDVTLHVGSVGGAAFLPNQPGTKDFPSAKFSE